MKSRSPYIRKNREAANILARKARMMANIRQVDDCIYGIANDYSCQFGVASAVT